MKKKLLYLCALTLFNAGAEAQLPITPLMKRTIQATDEIVSEAPVIFEGTVLESKPFWGKNNDGDPLASNIVHVHKVFKGTLKSGTVEVITAFQGTVYNPKLKKEVTYQEVSGALIPGTTAMFICKPNSRFVLDNKPAQSGVANATPLEVFNQFTYDLGFGPPSQPAAISSTLYGAHSFTTIDELYNYMTSGTKAAIQDFDNKIFKKETVLPQMKNKLQAPQNNNPKPDTTGSSARFKEFMRMSMLKGANKKQAAKGNRILSSKATYTFENPHYLFNSIGDAEYFEFDVYISSDVSGYFDNGLAIISYNQNVFGTNIFANGNATITRGSVISSTSNYDNPSVSDYSSTELAFTANSSFSNSNKTEYYLTASVPAQLFHVKIHVSSCGISKTGITFSQPQNMSNVSFISSTANGNSIFGWDTVNATDKEDRLACSCIIDQFSPATIQAGNGSVLTITGSSFGTKMGSVYFKNANYGAGTLQTAEVDATPDIISWSDTQIKIKMPSTVNKIDPVSNQFKVAGTGTFDVFNNNTFNPSSSSLLVEYAVRTEAAGNKARSSLADINSTGGYRFFLDPSAAADEKAIACVVEALKKWTCATGINWRLGGFVAAPGVLGDGVSTIYFGTSLNSSTLMSTKTAGAVTCSGGIQYYPEFDIEINKSFTFFYDPTNSTAGGTGQDFYNSILHEFGHCHQLKHVNNIDDMMYYASGSSSTGVRKTSLSAHDQAGGNNVKTFSVANQIPSGCGSNMSYISSEDLYMQNSPSPSDDGYEPDYITSEMWISKDIWIRQTNDGIANQESQPVEYTFGQPVYVYVKVRNKGCQASSAGESLTLNWAKASTGLSWPTDWDGSVVVSGQPYSGLIGTQSISTISPGGETILTFSWIPPNPNAFQTAFGTDFKHFCLLARVVGTNNPMTFPEISSVYTNTKFNNNIAWKNITIMNDVPGIIGHGGVGVGNGVVNVRNVETTPVVTKFGFKVPKDEIGNSIFDKGTVKVNIGKELFDIWTAGGRVGNGVTVLYEYRLPYEVHLTDDHLIPTKIESVIPAIDISPNTPVLIPILAITSPDAYIGNITFAGREEHNIRMEFSQKIALPSNGKNQFNYDVIQYNTNSTPVIVGGERYIINALVDQTIYGNKAAREVNSSPIPTEEVLLYPNPAQLQLTISFANNTSDHSIRMTDLLGHEVFRGNMNQLLKINTSSMTKGVYFIEISNVETNEKQVKRVIVN